MKISEIFVTPRSVPTPIINYQYKFDDSPRSKINNNLEFAHVIDTFGEQYYGIFKDNNLISYLEVAKLEHPFFQVVYSNTDSSFRQHGFFRFLLSKAINDNGPVGSDITQSPEARDAWIGLLKNPKELSFKMFDTKDNKFYNIDVDRIWDNTYDRLVVALKS